jgi:hypothetical protein
MKRCWELRWSRTDAAAVGLTQIGRDVLHHFEYWNCRRAGFDKEFRHETHLGNGFAFVRRLGVTCTDTERRQLCYTGQETALGEDRLSHGLGSEDAAVNNIGPIR